MAKKNTHNAVSSSKNISKTNFIILARPYDALPYKPIIDVGHPDLNPMKPSSRSLSRTKMAKKRRLFPNPSILVSHYYPYKLIEHIVLCSNKYRNKRMSELSDIKIFNNKLTNKKNHTLSIPHSWYYILLQNSETSGIT